MFNIASIEIAGFRGAEGQFELPLDPDVNFFIGRNGTGKTRLMNLLNFSLTGDVRNLMQIDFRSVLFRLSRPGDRSRPYIRISKGADENGYPELTYQFAVSSRAKAQTLRVGAPDLSAPWLRRHYRALGDARYYVGEEPSDVAHVKANIDKFIQLSWISVHRAAMEAAEEREKRFESLVDRKAHQVARDFGIYFSILDKSAAEETDKFQQVYLLALISPSGFDALSSMETVNPDDEKAAIRGMFAEFNIKSSVYSSKLESFTKRMAKALENYKPNSGLDANDFLVLTDTIRIHDAVKEWHKMLEKRASIYAPRDTFLSILNGMLYKKSVSINTGNQPVFHSENGDDLDLEQLSSGEKQLFILLGETLLQRQRPCVFMADEPEISLHIDWQERLVPSLRKINPNAQIIFATHSPDVVGAYGDNTIDLEKL